MEKYKHRLIIVFLIIGILCCFGYSISVFLTMKQSDDITTEIHNNAVPPSPIQNVPNVQDVQDLQSVQETPLTRKINWNYLYSINKDVIGWIYIPDTNIDFPLLYSGDNTTYLRHDITKRYNDNGGIWLDGNAKSLNDSQAIIYGHRNAWTGDRFTELGNFVNDSNFFTNHDTIYIYLPDGSINIYTIFGANEYNVYQEKKMYAYGYTNRELVDKAMSDCRNTREINKEDSIIMLSSCAPNNEAGYRNVVFATLVENKR